MRRIALIFLPLLALGWLWGFSWSGSLVPSDDVLYARMARSMLEGGDWTELTLDGRVGMHHRPPLGIWLLAGGGALAGFGELGLRLPGVLAGWLVLLLTFRLGAHLTDRRSAWLGALLLALSVLFYANARRPMTDVPFLAAMLGALLVWLETPPGYRGWGRPAALGALLGAAIMIKHGPAAIPLAFVAGHWALLRGRSRQVEGDERGPDWRFPAVTAGVACLVAAPWHLLETARHGAGFWREYLGVSVLQRVGGSWYADANPAFYLGTLLDLEGPLAGVMLAGLAVGLARVAAKRWRTPGEVTLLALFGLAFLPFQLSGTRLAHYALPCLPFLALLGGRALSSLLGALPLTEPSRGRVAVALGLALVALALPRLLPHALHPDYSPDQRRFGAVIRQQATPGARVAALDTYAQSLFWYADRKLDFLATTPEAAQRLGEGGVLPALDAVHQVEPRALPGLLAGQEAYLAVERESAEVWRELFAGAGRQVEVTPGGTLELLHLLP